jgi:hypothetical protein
VDLAFLGRDSPTAAQASYCAEDQGMYWEYHDLLYNSQESQIDNGWANSERLKAFAFSLDLDLDLFESCLDSGKYSKRVQYNVSEAKKHGVRGTQYNTMYLKPKNMECEVRPILSSLDLIINKNKFRVHNHTLFSNKLWII